MHLTILKQFRQAIYDALGHRKDSLFELSDALLTQSQAQSLPELSLSPLFGRSFSALYKALGRGRLDRQELRAVLAYFAPLEQQDGQRPMFALDASNIPRPLSPTARDRTCLHLPNLPEAHGAAITYGWQFSTVVLLPAKPGSQSYILDNTRIPSDKSACEVGCDQLAQLASLVSSDWLFCGDRYYGSCRFVLLSQKLPWDKLLRIKSNLVFYRAVVAPTKRGRGAPAKDEPIFKCKDATTQGEPDRSWQGVDEAGQPLKVSAWHNLHFRKARNIPLQVMRVERPAATGKKRDPRVSWFIWVAGAASQAGIELELNQVPSHYKRRYSQEHGYRFSKQDLLWQKPHLRRPEQFELWTDLVSIVQDELVLAWRLGLELRQPWESKARKPTLSQVRRGLLPIMDELGSPARASKVRGKGLGRAKGAVIKPALRYEVVRKGRHRPKKVRKAG